MEFRNIQKKVSALLRVTVVITLTPILLLFSVYLMMFDVQRFTIVVYVCVFE